MLVNPAVRSERGGAQPGAQAGAARHFRVVIDWRYRCLNWHIRIFRAGKLHDTRQKYFWGLPNEKPTPSKTAVKTMFTPRQCRPRQP
jgi:hypothetical protein